MSRRSTPGTPRWVKVFAFVFIFVILLIAVVLVTDLGGPHGPGRHVPSAEPAGDTSSGNAADTPSAGLAGHAGFAERGGQQS